jgi:hypothetical protein
MSDEAECHVAPDVCACNTPPTGAADPAEPPRLVAVVAGAMTLRRDPLQEASAIARLTTGARRTNSARKRFAATCSTCASAA